MPSVVTEEPAMPTASRRLKPVSHQMIREKPSRIRRIQTPNKATTAPGPTKERMRSRTS